MTEATTIRYEEGRTYIPLPGDMHVVRYVDHVPTCFGRSVECVLSEGSILWRNERGEEFSTDDGSGTGFLPGDECPGVHP
jgi:hypothetical protein